MAEGNEQEVMSDEDQNQEAHSVPAVVQKSTTAADRNIDGGKLTQVEKQFLETNRVNLHIIATDKVRYSKKIAELEKELSKTTESKEVWKQKFKDSDM